MATKKSRLVYKQDFINYFNRPSSFWFLSNEDLEGLFNSYYKKKPNLNYLFDSDSEQDLNEQIEFDPLDLYLTEKNIKLSKDSNPRFIEGKLIYEKLTDFLFNYCKQTLNIFNFVDFNELFPDEKFDLETKAKKISEYIDNTNTPTLFFNSIFIHNSSIATPLGIIWLNSNHCEIIFAKASTSTKRSDILSFYFQIEIVKNIIPLKNGSIFLFARERKPKGYISFSITDSIYLTKGKKTISKKQKKEKDKIKKNNEQVYDLIKISDLIKGNNFPDFQFLNQNYQEIKLSIKYLEFLEQYQHITNEFWNIVKEINSATISNNLSVPFVSNFDSYWNKFNYQKHIRNIWGIENEIFLYSGKVITFDKAFNFVSKYKPNLKISLEFFLNFKFLPTLINFYKIFLNEYNENKSKTNFFDFNSWSDKSKNDIFKIIFEKNDLEEYAKPWTKQEICWFSLIKYPNYQFENLTYFINDENSFEKLKNKKIYFDFETINPAIRAVDNSYPFAQIITQCSVIRDDGKNQKLKCNNLIVDPQKINKEFFKKVVDALYVENYYEYDYIVYNASFEKSRLLELKDYLLDPIYDAKIDSIVSNLYDLADWFNVNNKKWYIWIKELYGYYSIKNLLGLIPNNCLIETGTKSYQSLNVQKGDRAQALTSLRYFKVIDDKEWTKLSQDLCDYCENDVKAMIAAEKFGLKLIEEFNKNKNKESLELQIFRIITVDDLNKQQILLKTFLNSLKEIDSNKLKTFIKNMHNELINMEETIQNQNNLRIK